MSPLLSFTVFKEKILSGEKIQTIRKMRKYPIKEGDKLYLYWHCRQKDCEKLGESVCVDEQRINMSIIDQNELCVLLDQKCFGCGWRRLTFKELWKLAIDDGFDSIDDMKNWFKKTHSNLDGEEFQVIRWKKFVSPKNAEI